MIIKTIANTILLWLKVLKFRILILFFKKKTKNRHVLLLAPYMPPNTSGGVYRPISFTKYALENEWHMSVVTKGNSITGNITEAGLFLSEQIPNACEILFANKTNTNVSWRLTPQIDGSFVDAIAAVEKSLAKFTEKTPNIIVATGPSFDYFIAGYYLSLIYKVPLVLDYRDEWTENPFAFVSLTKDDLNWEKKIFQHADAVVFTTKSMLEHQARVFERNSNLFVVNNGWESQEVNIKSVETNIRDKEQINLLYAGVLAEHTPPFDFLDDLSELIKREKLTNVIVTFLGRVTDDLKVQLLQFNYPFIVEINGSVPKNEAILRMKKADALLLFTSTRLERYIPGKLFDYAISGTPILMHGNTGEVTATIETAKLGYSVENGDLDNLASILNAIKSKQKFQDEKVTKDWVYSKSRQNLAKEFFNILDDIVLK